MKTIFAHTFKTLVLGVVLAASVHSASATAVAHTYVSGVGSDSNPCSRTAPCATFQHAVNNTLAGGVVSVMDLGDYGQVTITQAVTIDGTGVQASIVVPSSNAPAITISGGSSDTIILRHLTLTGLSSSNNGVVLTSGSLVMDDCKISGFINEYGLNLAGSGTALVENTTITGCGEGIGNFGSVLLSLRNVTLQGNRGVGLYAQGGPTDISHSQITQNAGAGLYAYSSTLSASDCMISGNGTAVYADGGSTIRLINNDILNNTTGITTTASSSLFGFVLPLGIVSSTGDNRKAGNGTSGSVTPGKVIVQQ